jgi:hypothetical protein
MEALRFAGEWCIPADADRVYAALANVDSYPKWWPGFAAVERFDGRSGAIKLHTLLPVDLIFTATQRTADIGRRVLVARFSGSVEGVGRWEINPVRGGARARYYEHIAVRIPLARRAGVFARPVIHAGHAHLMRVGERGLTRYLGDMQ